VTGLSRPGCLQIEHGRTEISDHFKDTSEAKTTPSPKELDIDSPNEIGGAPSRNYAQ
jgi:hypothetical protein